jgi:hypothetical protein
MKARRFSLLIAAALTLPHAALAQVTSNPFPHEKHANLFPECITCHAGAKTRGSAMWPAPQSCRACHDGKVQPAVEWSAAKRIPGNVRFDHAIHQERLAARNAPEAQCQDCHATQGADRMQVQRAVAARCFECHEPKEHHAEGSECATCHVPLWEAAHLTNERVAQFPKPPSHQLAEFAAGGHGKSACPKGKSGKESSSCAVCHAIQFCETCHVDAASNECISTLGSDPRSLVHQVKTRTPDSHQKTSFLTMHGHGLEDAGAQCGTCHTQSSCTICHASTPGVAAALLSAPARPGVGALVERKKPASHHENFLKTHGNLASADPGSCAACHHRAQCLDCHRTSPSSGTPGYHSADFLQRHPAAAYARETSCAECHNPGSFCQTCHEASGVAAGGGLRGAGYHDANPSFLLGHGPSARMSLESCVSCHTESDCLVCHSAQGGRRFNPHGPEFEASILREKAPQMCTVCHGAAIPK